MTKIKSRPALCLFILALAGCATGPKYSEVRSTIPQLSADKGRIYFYRSANIFGSGIQPSVKLNGNVVGESKPGGFFYVDVPPGDYEVVLTTEVDKKLTFSLNKRQERCVRMTVGLGVVVYRVYPEIVDATQCEKELVDLSYVGSPGKQ